MQHHPLGITHKNDIRVGHNMQCTEVIVRSKADKALSGYSMFFKKRHKARLPLGKQISKRIKQRVDIILINTTTGELRAIHQGIGFIDVSRR